MMKSTKNIFQILIVFLLAHIPLYAQYNGGISDGNSQQTIVNTVCGTPASFYAYIGGSGEGNSVQTLINSVCGTPPGGFAYLGGNGDGNSQQTITNTTCGLPPGAYAYTGGTGDGQVLSNLLNAVCPTPPQFYAYFGASGDGAGLGKSVACAIVLPVADFSANPNPICVTNDVTFTDSSTNVVAWEWTVTGGVFVNPSTMFSQNPVVKYNTAGTYAVTLKARNHDGDDLETKTSYIVVNATASITGTTPSSRCGAGSVMLAATPSSGTIRWYNAATAGTLLFTGNSFTTSSISTNTTYYAEAFNGCTSATRTAVLATINAIPTITGNPASRCDTGIVTISASPSAGTVTWYDAATGGNLLSTGSTYTTPSLTTSTSYYAETTTIVGCPSVRIEVIATVNSTPTITSVTNGSSCGGATTTISVTPSAGTVNWYNAATGGSYLGTGNSLSVNGVSASYYAEVTQNGCTSARTEVTYINLIVPSIVTTSPNSRCGIGSVTLGATFSSGTISWYDTPFGGSVVGTGTSFNSPSISTSTTYYVEAVNGTCSSTRTAVTASVTITSAPTGAVNQTFCNTEMVGSIAITGTNVVWYDAAMSGNVVSNTTPIVSGTTYYASQSISGCESDNRLAVIMTTGGCLGIEEFDATYLKVYPNPVSDILTIENSVNLSKVEVINMLGQVVYSNIENSSILSINMNSLTSATYLVRIYDSENRIKVLKVIKK